LPSANGKSRKRLLKKNEWDGRTSSIVEKKLLNFQADKIEMVLAAHKAPARVCGGRLTPRAIQFHLAPAATTKVSKLETLTEEVALALGASSARITRDNGTLSVEVPRSDSRFVSLAELNQRLEEDEGLRRALSVAGTAILGLDNEGVPLLLRLSSPDVAHCLIAGTTGSGKTELARTLVVSLVMHQKPRDVQIAIFDPKGHSFALLANTPHLLFPIASSTQETIDRMQYLVDEMERRDHQGDLGQMQATRPRIIVVVDELADVLHMGGKSLETLLTRLVQRGRSAGVSVVACTQKPSAAAVGTLMRTNFPVRMVGRVTSANDALVAAGMGGTGAEKLAGRGDFFLIAGGQTLRFQAAQTSARDMMPTATGKQNGFVGRMLRLVK
jgi:S-DNA-T family DNA segregation ATPase FtsK/SpoIIIE